MGLDVSHAQSEVEVQASSYRQRVSVLHSCSVGFLALVTGAAVFDIIGEELSVEGDVMSLHRLFLCLSAEIFSDFHFSTVDSPVFVAGILAPPGEHSAGSEGPSPAYAGLDAEVRHEEGIIEQVGLQGVVGVSAGCMGCIFGFGCIPAWIYL